MPIQLFPYSHGLIKDLQIRKDQLGMMRTGTQLLWVEDIEPIPASEDQLARTCLQRGILIELFSLQSVGLIIVGISACDMPRLWIYPDGDTGKPIGRAQP